MTHYEIKTELIEANGHQFEVNICGNGNKFAICLHGFPESAHSLPFLAKLGYTVWAPNLRGYGQSYCPSQVDDFLLEHLRADLAGLIDAAGFKSTLLIAHDWGGIIAWDFAIRHQRPLNGFIPMNIPHPLLLAEGAKKFRQLRKSWYVLFFQIPRLPEFALSRNDASMVTKVFRNMAVDKSRFTDEIIDVYREQAAKPKNIRAMINYYRANFPSKHPEEDTTTWSQKLDTPTLLIWGEEDSALGKELTFGTGDYVEDFEVAYLPKVSHWVQQEAPEKVNSLMEVWLKHQKLV